MKARYLRTTPLILAAGLLSAGLRAQGATDGTITGSGTAGYIPKFTGALTIGNSNIFWNSNGGKVGIAMNNPAYRLDVNGTIQGTALRSLGGVSCVSLDTGNGANQLYPMNQAVRTTDAVSFATVNTGHGASELFPMNQAVRTTDQVTFYTLTAPGGADVGGLDVDTRVRIDTVQNSYSLEVGGIVRADQYLTNSDSRLKREIQPLEGSLARLMTLRGVTYRGPEKDQDGRAQLGVIAQEVEAVFPEAVFTDNLGYKSVSYSRLVAVLIEAVKEQQRQIEILQARTERWR